MTWWNKDSDMSTLKMFGHGLEELGKLIVYTANTGSLTSIEEFEKGSSLTQPNQKKKE